MKAMLNLPFILMLISPATFGQQAINQTLRIGLYADIQYCDCDTRGTRHYRTSLQKIEKCVEHFNREQLDFIVDLGDRIDQGMENFAPVDSVLARSAHPVILVPGNHDFSVEDRFKKQVVSKTGSHYGYHVKTKGKWKFLFLHGLKQSIPATREGSLKNRLAHYRLKQLQKQQKPNAHDWNGGLGRMQTRWLKKEIRKAEKQSMKLVIFCHQPLASGNPHNLWNDEKIREMLKHFSGPVYWINGHDHQGGYVQDGNLSLITIHGMVEEESNSYAILELSDDLISIQGFGRQPDLHPGR